MQLSTLVYIIFISLTSYSATPDGGKNSKNHITISHNIETELATITVSGLYDCDVSIIDNNNTIIYSMENATESITVNITTDGTYFVRIKSQDNTIIIQRFIIKM